MAAAGSPVGAAPREVELICTGESGDVAGTPTGAGTGFGQTGLSSQFIVEILNSQDPTGTYPLPGVTVTLDHDLPDLMTTGDTARTVSISGTARLSDAFLGAMRSFQIARPLQADAAVSAQLNGPGVSGSHAQSPSATLTQPIAGPGTEFPIDLELTATPTPEGGAVELSVSTDWSLHVNQRVSSPIPLNLGTLSMSCESAGPVHELASPHLDDEEFPADFRPGVRLPQPVADSYVARPGGVVARTDRTFDNSTSAMIDVLGNDESLDPARIIDPSTLKVVSIGPEDHWDADVSIHGNSIMVSPEPLSMSDMYDEFESEGGGWGGIPNPPPGIEQVGFGPPVFSLGLLYEVCDDGEPASCAEGTAEVTVGVDMIDPCDDPLVDVDCGPSEPEVDPTCADNMSVCEVPGCSWSEADGRYVCVYPGPLPPEPKDAGPGDHKPQAHGPGDVGPPDGRGPGADHQPPPGTPLAPTFTA